MDDKILEFQISGCIYTGKGEVTVDNLSDAFVDFCISKGWKFCGVTSPLEVD